MGSISINIVVHQQLGPLAASSRVFQFPAGTTHFSSRLRFQISQEETPSMMNEPKRHGGLEQTSNHKPFLHDYRLTTGTK